MARTYVSPLGVFFLIVGSHALDTSTGVCGGWKMDHDWENYIDESTISWQKHGCRLIECAMHCSRDPLCFSFFYHTSLKTCLGSQSFKRCLPANWLTQHGWNYYTQPQHCAEDYVYNQTLGLCYKWYHINMDYQQAMALCESDRAKLLIINNPEELQHFAWTVRTTGWTWIGLQGRTTSPSVFKWWNGQEATYIPWYPEYPKVIYDSGVHLVNGKYVNKPFSTRAWNALCQKLI